MKIGVISDIEGNDMNLISVLSELAGFDQIVNLGDCVGNKGNSDDAIGILQERNIVSVMGNHDLEIVIGKDVAPSFFLAPMIHESTLTYYPVFELNERNKNFLKNQHMEYKLKQNDVSMLFCHSLFGKYQDSIYYEYVDKTNALELYDNKDTNVVFIGHKHVPRIFEIDGSSRVRSVQIGNSIKFRLNLRNRYVVDVGSVGALRLKDMKYSYAIFDPDSLDLFLIVK